MATKTTKDLIKILPFDKTFQIELLNSFDSLDDERKDYITQTLWDAYYLFYKINLQEKLGQALLKFKRGEETMDENFYNRVRDAVEKDMQVEFYPKATDADLSAVRAKLEAVINEHKQQDYD